MNDRVPVLLGLLLLGLATASATVAFSPVNESDLDKSTDLTSVHAILKSVPLKDAWKAVWSPVRVTFNCTSAAVSTTSTASS
jgi:hypothetical protein